MTSFDPATKADIARVSAQLGRPARGVLGVGARCVCGAPVVVVTHPRIDDGTPFPTLYYLTHPEANREASRLEAAGKMSEYVERLHSDRVALTKYRRAHEDYVHSREAIEVVDEIRGISAGGMPDRVKCLHALIAHRLAVGPGINPVGDWAYEDSAWKKEVCSCVVEA
jgi:uncharacterized protein